MSKKMLIDASHPEETRVVVVDGTRVEELDYESENKRQLRGNVYLARVTRVEPSLQAAFVEYGGNRHGFLAFSEIHPDYYQIPHEDRIALLEAEKADSIQEEEEEETKIANAEKGKGKKGLGKNPKSQNDESDDEAEDTDAETSDDDDSDNDSDQDSAKKNDDSDDDTDESEVSDASEKEVEDEQKKMHGARRKRQSRRRYKIQEVVKRGQILLIQAVKEERGNKGAAMTTYLSLAGRYCVLMPNTPRGGGISRKISNGSDRKRLKSVMSELSVPQGMGVIVRTAGAKRTKVEIKRDYDYLSRLWDTIRDTTLKSIAPTLIHEEGNLVKRSIRDLYGKDIESVLVQGDEAYRMAKDFIKMLMPSHAKNVQPYKDDIPLFLRYQVEQQIESCLEPIAQLKSGGYLVIHPTEALVSVDVNSGRSTKERNVERTALKTNLETCDELARQMRLRDLAGLIVVDFIDMDENRNNRAVEKRMRDALSKDRARVQMSKISQFGLMEISRQRRRRSLLEGSTASCNHCHGVGRKRSVESSALKAVRAVEEEAIRGRASRIRLTVAPDVANYLFNEKRELLNQVDSASDMFTEIISDPSFIRPKFEIERLVTTATQGKDPLEEVFKENRKTQSQQKNKKQPRKEERSDDETDEPKVKHEAREAHEDDENKPKRKRRRGRRGGRGRRKTENPNSSENSENPESENTESGNTQNSSKENNTQSTEANETTDSNATAEGNEAQKSDKPKRKRQRSRKENTQDTSDEAATIATEEEANTDEKPKRKRRSRKKVDADNSATISEDAPKTTEEASEEKPKPKRRATKKKTENTEETPKAKAKPRAKKAEVKDEKPVDKKTTAKKSSPKKTTSPEEKPKKEAKATKPKAKPKASPKASPKTKEEKPAKPTEIKEEKAPTPAPKPTPDPKVEAEAEAAKEKRRSWWKKRNPFS
ncbi:MAG: ribonuclease [Robiginitomaculum sp.]|nr:MAG: ribonuclease [Robiginitomaculum sp.]